MVFHIGQWGAKTCEWCSPLPNGDDMSESARKRCANRSKSTPAAKRSRSEGERLGERRGEEATNPDNNGGKKGAQFKFPDAANGARGKRESNRHGAKNMMANHVRSWNNEEAITLQSAS